MKKGSFLKISVNFILIIILLFSILNNYYVSVVATGIAFICFLPLVLEKTIDLFSPWANLYYFILINVLLRSLFIDIEIKNGNYFLIDSIFLHGKPYSFLVNSTWIILLGFVLAVVGYSLPQKSKRKYLLNGQTINKNNTSRYKKIILGLILISTVALVFFIEKTMPDQFTIENIAQYRGVSDDLTLYRAHGYLRFFANFATLAAFLSFSEINFKLPKKTSTYIIFFVIAFGISNAIAFYTQSRASIVFNFLNLYFIFYYLSDKKISIKSLLCAIIFLCFVFYLMTCLRGGSGFLLSDPLNIKSVITSILLNNGGIDASKTGHVIDFIKNSNNFQYGKTLVHFLVMIIPRELWKSKPPNLDTYVGQEVYGSTFFGTGAVPPGFFAEMYMNFGFTGILIGSLFLGFFLKKINYMAEKNKRNKFAIVFYVLVFQQVGISIFGSGVSSTIIGMLMTAVPLAFSYYLAKRPWK